MRHHINRAIGFFGGLTLLVLIGPASAQQYSREQDVPEVRLGQHVFVDDGSCPTGQIKEITGTNLTASGVARARKCVPRPPTIILPV
eukprot:gene34382-46114_t